MTTKPEKEKNIGLDEKNEEIIYNVGWTKTDDGAQASLELEGAPGGGAWGAVSDEK